MNKELEQRIAEALRNPRNVGELENADAVGTVGDSDCGEMLRLWIKYKEENGKKVIDRATFQSFGCETAIAVASLATQLIKGKTAEEALALKTDELAGELGPLPPMKIHCAQLVEGALRSALESKPKPATEVKAGPDTPQPSPASANAPSLLDRFVPENQEGKGVRIVFLEPNQKG
jgi:nitrogen fixation protein NifU and related proteins